MGGRRMLFVAPSAYPLGGVATWLAYLLPGLARSGWQPLLGLTAGRHHDSQAYARTYPDLETVAIANPTGSHEGRIRALADTICKVQPAVVLGVNIPDTYCAVARLTLSGIFSCRCAMTLHGIQPDLLDDVSRFREVLDSVIGTNRLACRLANDAGMPAQRVHYAPYGVGLPDSPVQRDPSPTRRLRVAFVGRFEQEQKRVADLPRIAHMLAARGVDFEFLLAGAGPDEAGLRQAMAQHEAAGRVRFLGTLPPAELMRCVYRHADALLLTSSWETGPIVAWEAMAHGVTVVSSSYVGCGLEGALQDGRNCLLFPIGDHEAAAARITMLLNPQLRQQLADQAVALVRQRYTYEQSIAAWDRCLREVLRTPPQTVTREPMQPPSGGRLDRILGTRGGESLRRWTGRRHLHADPGGEWPHSYGLRNTDDPAFWAQASKLDERTV